MKYQVFEYLLKGSLITKTARELIYGYETDLTDSINTGDMLRGNLYIDSIITPVMNNFMGPTSARSLSMLTGEENVEDAGKIW
jgi:hypothetical protein